MRRSLSALAVCASALLLVAARCGGDEDDGVHIGAYPKVEGEESGAGAAAPPDDVDLSADPAAKSSADADADAILDQNGGAEKAPAETAAKKPDAKAKKTDPTKPKLDDDNAAPRDSSDDLFADPLDGANPAGGRGPTVDDNTMLDDSSTFEPGGSGLPNAVGPDGDSLPQIPGPGPSDDLPDLGGPGSDLTE
jgi:hypothetical protein